MAMLNPYEQYQQNAVHTASQEELVLMLYNGLLKFIKQGIFAFENKDNNSIHNNLIRAQEIVLHLNASLDEKYEISKNLSALYDYMYRKLVEANMNKDPEIVNEVFGMAKEFRDTWQQAMKKSP